MKCWGVHIRNCCSKLSQCTPSQRGGEHHCFLDVLTTRASVGASLLEVFCDTGLARYIFFVDLLYGGDGLKNGVPKRYQIV